MSTATAAADRVLPHNLDAERAVLGSMLLHDPARAVAFSTLAATDFYRDAHRKVFEAIRVLSERAVAADLITLREALGAETLDAVGGPAYLASLTDGIPRSANVEHYAGIVREKARLRATIAAGLWLVGEAYGGARPAVEIIGDATQRLARDVASSGRRPVSAYDAGIEYAAGLDAGTAFLPTGYADVDSMIGGVAIGDLTVVAARPSVGKTSWVLGAAKSFALAGIGTAVFSLEMKRAQLAARLMCWGSGIPTTTIERGLATDAEYARFFDAQQALAGLPLYIDDYAGTLVEFDAWCRRLRDEHGSLGAVVVDYIQLMGSDDRRASRQEQVAGFSRGLKRIARDLNVAMVALSQLSRAPETRSDKRPHLSDLRESGALEQDADVAILLFRQEMHKRTQENEGLAEAIVGKNRTGPVGVTRLQFEKEFARFRDLTTADSI